MIQAEKLSYGFPAKDLYHEISFTIERGQHCALIGSNGTGKSTLADLLIHPEDYLYDGKITRDEDCRIGYASQFSVRDKSRECTVFEYLSQRFLEIQNEIGAVCEEMADPDLEAEQMDAVFRKYQNLLDANEAMDGDNYESNIRRQLHTARMEHLEKTRLSQISGGEYKLLQIMREMLLAPNLLVLDEPDVFLDFANLSSLCQLINGYKGTLLVITHNRYLLNHCFNKILHLENTDLQEFDGNYTEYRCSILREKLRLRIQNLEEQEEIARTEQMVERLRKRATLMVNPTIGQSVNAKQTQLDRLLARQIKAPFIEVREPRIKLPEVAQVPEVAPVAEVGLAADAAPAAEPGAEPREILTVTDYQVDFDHDLLQNVSFTLRAGEKAALVGANGTGKTTLIRDILKNQNPAIRIDENTRYACLSQLQAEAADGQRTVQQVLLDAGLDSRTSMEDLLSQYTLPADVLEQRVCELSGGEQNLLQIALISISGAEFLILDEPTSHLDLYGQTALEKAVAEYKGTVLMVSHDFYLVANCADFVLLTEGNTVRRMRTRNFRKMVYEKYFDQKYLEKDKKKQELEAGITAAFQKNDLAAVDRFCTELEALSEE
ncbi:MAG: ATP-binding cassette domain-containing protein [Anaerovoracaceae bacterium]|nr:ATP-binding cassette domain-containing protein [Anaerovoracaceae bacterium]